MGIKHLLSSLTGGLLNNVTVYVNIERLHFADRRGELIMNVSGCSSWPTLSLHSTDINNIMCAVKTLYRLR